MTSQFSGSLARVKRLRHSFGPQTGAVSDGRTRKTVTVILITVTFLFCSPPNTLDSSYVVLIVIILTQT